MNEETAIELLEHTAYDDFNLLDHQIKGRLEAIQVLIKQKKQLQNNWNELKEYLNTLEEFYVYPVDLQRKQVIQKIKNKMQELEGNNV